MHNGQAVLCVEDRLGIEVYNVAATRNVLLLVEATIGTELGNISYIGST